MAMTLQQERHLFSLIQAISTRVDSKYRKGQAEHGGDLMDMSPQNLVENMIEEAIDQLVYSLTFYEKIKKAKETKIEEPVPFDGTSS